MSIQLIRFQSIAQHLIYFQQKHSLKMDLEWLLPQQIEQIIRLCDLSSIQDASVAANILQQHHWNFEQSLNDLVGQNDQVLKQEARNLAQKVGNKPVQQKEKQEEHNDPFNDQSQFELGPDQYHHFDHPQLANQLQPTIKYPNHSSILAQQNKEYEMMEKTYIAKQAEDKEREQYLEVKDKQYESHRQEFANHTIERPIQIKFRLSNKSDIHSFDISDKVEKVFKYVSGHLREDFENKDCDFDLTQAFPSISLKQNLGGTLEEIFGQSAGEVLIVKEL